MDLYDTGIGDVIDLPAHHPRRVQVTDWARTVTTLGSRGEFARVSWQGTGPWVGWSGTTLLSERTQITMMSKAGPDDPVRRQYEDELERELAKLAATIGEE